MKKVIIAVMCILLLGTNAHALELSAHSAVLIDGETGRIIFSKNCRERLAMASTTKIMTALLALERGRPDDMVTVSDFAARQEGSSMYLKAGENISLGDLLYGLMLSSGNDAAVAIAEHVSGSVEAFAKDMSSRAMELGAYSTSFKNPSGLDDEGHYTTAADLALITKAALENEDFKKICSTKSIKISGETDRYLTNHNKMLFRYEGCIGVKTGYTKKSGRSLVSAAERDGWRVIAVTINAPDDWNDHERMLNFAYDTCSKVEIAKKRDMAGSAYVRGGNVEKVSLVYCEDLTLRLSSEEQKRLEVSTVYPDFLDAPVKIGQTIGEVVAVLDGEVLGRASIQTNDYSGIETGRDFKKSLYLAFSEWLLLARRNKMIV